MASRTTAPRLDPYRTRTRSAAATASNRARSRRRATSSRRWLTKAARSGVASSRAENPQKRRNETPSSSASASFTSDTSYQIEISNALNSASGGHVGSPSAAVKTPHSACAIGVQSISASTHPATIADAPRDTQNPSFPVRSAVAPSLPPTPQVNRANQTDSRVLH